MKQSEELAASVASFATGMGKIENLSQLAQLNWAEREFCFSSNLEFLHSS
jgi:hypothetical protein